jgi:Uma2 family endonuclease
LSPATQRKDRALKVPLYRQHGVGHVWLVDPAAQMLEVYWLQTSGYLLVATFSGDAPVLAEPFDAIEFDLGALWQR